MRGSTVYAAEPCCMSGFIWVGFGCELQALWVDQGSAGGGGGAPAPLPL